VRQAGFSIVAAVHGVEAYLEEFFRSLEAQTVGMDRLEIIMVDDGSPDASFEIIERWRQRYPTTIRCVRQQNGGVASARNAGLRLATRPWVTFIDPDDFVVKTYFERVERFLGAFDHEPLAMVCTNLTYFDEIDGKHRDDHPLRYRFQAGNRTVPVAELTEDIHLATHTALFRRERLEASGLRFDERVVPDFEDAHFVARYLLGVPDGAVGFVPKAKYRYRRRADASSLLQTSWHKPTKYDDSLRYGCLELLEATAAVGPVPVWLQRTVLYHLQWYFRQDARLRSPTAALEADQLATFHMLVSRIMEHIDAATIDAFELGRPWAEILWALGSYRGQQRHSEVAIGDYDPDQRVLHLRYYYTCERPHERFLVDGVAVEPWYEKTQAHVYFGRTLFHERRIWIPARQRARTTEVELAGRPTPLVMGWVQPSWRRPELFLRRRHLNTRRWFEPNGYRPDTVVGPHRWKVLALRRAARLEVVQRRYGDAWIFIDRDSQADDNAEHLYRWIKEHHPEVNAWFMIDRGAQDWERLRKDGFRLLPHGWRGRALALLNAEHLISSHLDQYIVAPLPRNRYGDLMRWRFTFLQHGVTTADMSRWFNQKRIDVLTTATADEYRSIVADGTPYRLTAREVRPTGFPRHDALLAKASAVSADDVDTILIAPTWRNSLVGTKSGTGNQRQRRPDFFDTEYARRWRSLLNRTDLREAAERHGKRIVFMPHANMQMYLDGFDAPPHVSVVRHADGSIQDLFVRTALLVTDYSSVAFEAAFLGRAVVYYQFDRATYFGEHWRPGYFDADRDGFGPVVDDEDDLVRDVADVLERGGPAERYVERIERTFPHRDGRACERVYEAILASRSKRPPALRDTLGAPADVADLAGATQGR
jgi:CDP-glycerol glycerophosphotransferase (TagB/SpsB family)/glycosyltransferase involved in cell wall biosynthesis